MVKIHSRDLFEQEEFTKDNLNREEQWELAIQMGFTWKVLEGCWEREEVSIDENNM